MSEVTQQAQRARKAAVALANTSSAARNTALMAMADALVARIPEILRANAMDMTAAAEKGVAAPLLDRLMLDERRIEAIADALRDLARQTDPIGEVIEGRTLASGIDLKRVRVPLGVVAMIYEARPNVTADAAGLCLKTANACILRGSSMAANSNIMISDVLYEAALSSGMPAFCIQAIHNTHREATEELMNLHGLIDVLIPRGGAGLIKSVVENSRVPVIETGTGNCHIYLDGKADFDKARAIVVNAKCQRPGVCNAAESLLVDAVVAEELLPLVLRDLREQNVVLHVDETSARIAAAHGIETVEATEDDWGTEYIDLHMSVKVVDGVDEAIEHINRYGTRHSEAIISEDYSAVQRFLARVDAAAVYANASTRFTDGGEFGLGAEIGISTQKLHARGPMGLTALTSTKFILTGDGQVR